MVIKTKRIPIDVTPEIMSEMFGIPLGGTPILLLPTTTDDGFVSRWKAHFKNYQSKPIRPHDIIPKMLRWIDIVFLFKMSFLMLFANTMGPCETDEYCSFIILTELPKICQFRV